MTEPESDSEESYAYGRRQIDDMSDRTVEPGQGRITGYLALTLGAMSFLGVLCFRYPEYLTTTELRQVYDVDLLRTVLMICMWTALTSGLINIVRNRRKRLGASGLLFVALAYAFGGYTVDTGSVDPKIGLGLDWFLLDLLGSALVFLAIEKLVPKYPEQAVFRPEWKTDLAYFGMNHLLVAVLLLVGNSFAPALFDWAVHAGLQGAVLSLPLWGQVILLVACADFVQYWIHRAYHEVSFLWPLHAVHHSAEHMDWLAGSRTHVFQTLIDRTLVMVPLYLLGADKAAFDLYVTVAALQSVFAHANVSLRFGPLEALVVTPKFHHWHHSSDTPAIDTNYAVHLPLWDKLFGTYHMPDEQWPREYGTTKRLPRTFWAQFLYPLSRNRQADTQSEKG